MTTAPKFDQTLREFLEAQGGMIVMLSDDPLFVRTIRTTVFKTLGLKTNPLEVHQDPALALKSVRDHSTRSTPVLVMADRLLRGRHTLEFLRNVKTAFSETKTLVMTQETTKEELSLLYEIGVDSVITKPVSIDTLVEKMAGAIKPQGRLNQLVGEARRLLDAGETAKAMLVCQAILKIKENSPIALILMGDIHLKEGRRAEAIQSYEAAHISADLYLEPLKRLAEVHKDEDEDAYLGFLRKLDTISPLNTARKCDIAKVYVRKNDVEQADRYFSAAIANAQREAISHVENVVQDITESLAETSPDLAEKYYVRLLDMKGDNLTPEDMALFNRLGIALRRQGKWREAVDYYQKALAVVPTDERVLYNMGLAYADGQQYRMAVEAFEKVLRVDAEFHKTAPVVAYNMANAYAQARDSDMAQRFLSAALEMNPEHAPSRKLLARLKES